MKGKPNTWARKRERIANNMIACEKAIKCLEAIGEDAPMEYKVK